MQDMVKTESTTFTLAYHEGNKQYFISWNCVNLGGIVGFYDDLKEAEKAWSLLTPLGGFVPQGGWGEVQKPNY